jgi:hypothetical protein
VSITLFKLENQAARCRAGTRATSLAQTMR